MLFDTPTGRPTAERSEHKRRPDDISGTKLDADVQLPALASRYGKLPPFSAKDPAFWVHRLDTYFTCGSINNQLLKYALGAVHKLRHARSG